MQITYAEPVQATPQQFTTDFTAGGQYSTEAPASVEPTVAADPY